MNRLLYRGPSTTALHQRYAKQRRIDERAPVTTTSEVHINAPVQRVWELFANPAGWPTSAPDIHDVHLDAAVAVDTRFTWPRQSPHQVPVRGRRPRWSSRRSPRRSDGWFPPMPPS